MHVVISLLNFRPGKIGGTETYLRKLLPELIRQREGDRITLLAYRDNAGEITSPDAETVTVPYGESEITRLRILESLTPFRARGIERQIASLRPDVLFFPQQSIFPKRVAGRVVLTVLDFQHLVMPENFGPADRVFRAGIYPFSLRRADHILAISEFTRRQLLEFYRLPPERATVSLLGYDPPEESAIDGSAGVRGPYVYYPAASLVHKNHRQLFDSVAALRARGDFPYRLVLSGIQTKYWPKLAAHVARSKLDDIVEHVGYVSYARVQALYRAAEAVVFPTTYEGFGLPVMESISGGKKVIVSRLEIFQELGVPAAWQIDFSDPQQLSAALQQPGPTQLLHPPATWSACAAATWEALRGQVSHVNTI